MTLLPDLASPPRAAQLRPDAARDRSGHRILFREGASRGYSVRLARGEKEVHAAQALRFIVFNLELGEGLECSYHTCRDEDPFDAVCDHLLVEHAGEVVGTYRLQTGRGAAEHLGYYSEQEFDFTPFEPFRAEMVELGRACVAREHRNLIVLGLLWRGIMSYARERACRYLIGCGSVTSQDPAEGAALYAALREPLSAPAAWQTRPVGRYVCSLETQAAVAPRLPKLLTAYFSLGARICAPPAIDHDFKTIDFLTLLDLETLPAEAKALLLAKV